MITITFRLLADAITEYVSGGRTFEELRNFVYSRYEAEEDIAVEPAADEVLAVLAPYIEYEEAVGDPKRYLRLCRLSKALEQTTDAPKNLVVLALEYDELQTLLRKYDSGLLTDTVLRQQVGKLSPAPFDVNRVIFLARENKGGIQG